ncbi:50S ribosomal protein L10 [Patescibacteria group bacterium]|nr:50S ribosomal protein L10 [Patescibacteria group bacterium]
MPKTRQQKQDILDNLKDKLAKSKSVVFSSDNGLSVKTIEGIRKEMKQNNAEYLVAKKTLVKMATEDISDVNLDSLTGSVALTISYEDEVAGARLLNKYAKENEALQLDGGILEGKFIMADMVKRLANLPSKEQLLAKLVGSLNSPMAGIVGVLSGVQRNFVGVLSAIKDQKE